MAVRCARLCLVLVAFWAGACSRSEKSETAQPTPSGPTETLAFKVRVANTTGRALAKARVFLYAPVSDSAEQRADEVSASLPHEVVRDSLGNQRLVLELVDVPAGFTAEVAVRARLAFGAQPGGGAKASVRRPRAAPSAELASAAKALVRDTQRDTAQATLAWIEELSAAKADPLGAGLDSAGGRVAFAVELLRANGIPARAVLGARVRGGVLSGVTLAPWLEYALDGAWQRALPPAPGGVGERWVAMRVLREPGELVGADWTFERLFESGGLDVRVES